MVRTVAIFCTFSSTVEYARSEAGFSAPSATPVAPDVAVPSMTYRTELVAA
jgi:hypothetical protein